jgi:hypothetical protein
MKAARFYGPGDVRVEDIPEPVLREGQVKVKVSNLPNLQTGEANHSRHTLLQIAWYVEYATSTGLGHCS